MDLRDLLALETAKDAVRQPLLDEDTAGEPFWVVAEINDRMATGTLFAPSQKGKQFVALFQTRQDAVSVAAHLPVKAGTWAAPELSRKHLRFLLDSLHPEVEFGLVLRVDRSSGQFALSPVNRRELANSSS